MTTWVPPGKSIIGTCSICGGAVVVPDIWHGIIAPVPECSSCGAVKRESHGPIIDMAPRPQRITTTTTGGAAIWDYVNRGQLPPE